MKRIFFVGLLLVALAALVGPAVPFLSNSNVAEAAGASTYKVLVGAEQVSRGIDVMSYFPGTVHVHVGDIVNFAQNSHEIHTVTFLAGNPAPELIVPAPQPNSLQTPLMINPAAAFATRPAGGLYDGSTYANSGIMSLDPGQPQSFSLTFTKAGTYDYVCLVHGQMMSGQIIVEPASVPVLSPGQVAAQAHFEIARQMAKAPAVIRQAESMVQPATKNPDGTTTHHVMVGYSSDVIDIMQFFPSHLVVRPGDTVEWNMGDAPHTVTFLNGNPDIPFAEFVPPPAGPLLLINPVVLGPMGGSTLTRQGVYSSGIFGFMSATSYSLKIGNIQGQLSYECLLHDSSGMTGSLLVLPKD